MLSFPTKIMLHRMKTYKKKILTNEQMPFEGRIWAVKKQYITPWLWGTDNEEMAETQKKPTECGEMQYKSWTDIKNKSQKSLIT